ncbi:MAG: hypothetical protein HY394_04265 [Candidatus Diapherotrites archaeon]|nr:hypothetical protein [Candidatus Diapherotrites archaeon]
MAFTRFESKILSIKDEALDTKTFRFAIPEGVDFDFRPGQFVMLSFPDDSATVRSYSISSPPTKKGFFEITCNKVGKFTSRLFGAKPGDAVVAKGPAGHFVLGENDKCIVLVSGGTGIAPFRCMAHYITEKRLPTKVFILFSARTRENLIYFDELNALEKANKNVKAIWTLTRETPDGWNGLLGRFHPDCIAEAIGGLDGKVFYICGPNEMVASLNELLGQAGVAKENIRIERWG